MGDGAALGGFAVLYVGLLLLVLGIVWIVLPFAVFGIKPLLRLVLQEQRRTNTLLAELVTQAKAPAPQPPQPPRS